MASVARRVVAAMERIAPLRLAEKWDNVGLLVESPVARPNANQVLLTIDLTTSVCEEALNSPTAMIVSYHPPIFKPLSSITLSNPLQRSIMRCAASGISIYSPHTALDTVQNGVNDWLACAFRSACATVVPIQQALVEEAGVGVGRLIKLKEPHALESIYPLIKTHLGVAHLQIARAGEKKISSIALCAGSGSSVLKDVEADLYWTGEMGHHDVLAAVARGTSVILCGHTNTERGYLSRLQEHLRLELGADSIQEELKVTISEMDRDPLDIV